MVTCIAPRDIIARFAGDPSYSLPRSFFDDFVQVRRAISSVTTNDPPSSIFCLPSCERASSPQ